MGAFGGEENDLLCGENVGRDETCSRVILRRPDKTVADKPNPDH